MARESTAAPVTRSRTKLFFAPVAPAKITPPTYNSRSDSSSEPKSFTRRTDRLHERETIGIVITAVRTPSPRSLAFLFRRPSVFHRSSRSLDQNSNTARFSTKAARGQTKLGETETGAGRENRFSRCVTTRIRSAHRGNCSRRSSRDR